MEVVDSGEARDWKNHRSDAYRLRCGLARFAVKQPLGRSPWTGLGSISTPPVSAVRSVPHDSGEAGPVRACSGLDVVCCHFGPFPMGPVRSRIRGSFPAVRLFSKTCPSETCRGACPAMCGLRVVPQSRPGWGSGGPRVGMHVFVDPVAAVDHGGQPRVVDGEPVLVAEQHEPVSGERAQFLPQPRQRPFYVG